MPKAKIIYRANQEVIGKHLRSNEWIMYSGNLTIYDRRANPVVLKLKSEICDSFIVDIMNDRKDFKGNTISIVFGKLAKWFYNRGVIFQN